jgi:oxygen-independent coproporphyrinogen-3 oxidase
MLSPKLKILKMASQFLKTTFDSLVACSSLYMHWPFCPYKCAFCPFVAYAGRDCLMGSYHEALKQELCLFAQQKHDLDTVYIGGGTPSTYPVDKLLDMFGILNNVCSLNSKAEITLEVNPGTVDKEKIETWKQVGINRLSVGVQSLNDQILANLNRHQSVDQVVTLLNNVCDNFDSVSVDLIVGLPGVDFKIWQDTVKSLIKWPLKHISMYFLTVHQGTPLYQGIEAGKFFMTADQEVVQHYQWACEYLAEAGFMQYEVSSFAKPGFRAKHNSMYWQRKPFKGIGVGAFSFDGKRRIQNCKSIIKYLDSFESNLIDIEEFSEELTPEQVWLEKMLLGIRCADGVILTEILADLTPISGCNLLDFIAECRAKEFFLPHSDKLILSAKGAALENEILERINKLVVLNY